MQTRPRTFARFSRVKNLHSYPALYCAVVFFLTVTYACWRWVRVFQATYASLLVKWETDQWWWQQCNDMDFYEKMQEHMAICDNLKVTPISTLPWRAALDTTVHLTSAPGRIIATLFVMLAGLLGARVLQGQHTMHIPRVAPIV
jgi:hypothetical protein